MTFGRVFERPFAPPFGGFAAAAAAPLTFLFDEQFTTNNDLTVTTDAAMVGTYGLAIRIDDNTATYVQDNTPSAETRYRCRFYFDPNSITMAALDNHWILELKKADATGVAGLVLRYNSGYEIRLGIQNDSASYQYTAYASVTDAAHYIEVDWKASSAPGANDGTAEWWLDGVSQGSLSSLDNDTYVVDYILLGAVVGIDTGTRGTYYFDAFASNDDGGVIGA